MGVYRLPDTVSFQTQIKEEGLDGEDFDDDTLCLVDEKDCSKVPSLDDGKDKSDDITRYKREERRIAFFITMNNQFLWNGVMFMPPSLCLFLPAHGNRGFIREMPGEAGTYSPHSLFGIKLVLSKEKRSLKEK